MNNEHGKRNLILLGVSALLITTVTTGMSLWLYRSSGDIYLDRSRPGYLPEEGETEDPTNVNNSNYVFNENGELTADELESYLKELKKINDRIKALVDPYAPGPLTDESLGITAPAEEPKETKE